MKKLFTLTLLLLSAISTWAEDISLEAGDPKVLMKNVTAKLVFDYSETKVVNEGNKSMNEYLKSRGDDFVRDWPEDQKKAHSYFSVQWNRKTDGMKVDTDAKNAEYSMIVHVKTLDTGNGGSVFNPWASAKAGGTIVSGTIEIYNNNARKTECVVGFEEMKGTGSPSETVRYGMAYMVLASEFYDFQKRVKKGKVEAKPLGKYEKEKVNYKEPVAQESKAVGVPDPFKPKEDAAPAKETKDNKNSKNAKNNTAQNSKAQNNKSQNSKSQNNKTQAKPAPEKESAAGGIATVTLKNGTTLTGELTKFDPLKEITLVVAGHSTTIPMSQVKDVKTGGDAGSKAVEEEPRSKNTSKEKARQETRKEVEEEAEPVHVSSDGRLGKDKMLVTDNGKYAKSFTVNLGGEPVIMRLVRGGRMNMGFDGSHSRAMKSEPIHEVAVTSFYISEKALTCNQVKELTKKFKNKGDEPAMFEDYDDVSDFIDKVQANQGKNFRLPTEAEWEYAACCDDQTSLFRDVEKREKVAYDWCSDYHDEFSDSKVVEVDPTGPKKGREHVIRAYNAENGKFDRSNRLKFGRCELGYIRLVIKAKDYK